LPAIGATGLTNINTSAPGSDLNFFNRRHQLVPPELNNPTIKRQPALASAAGAEGERLMLSPLPAPVVRASQRPDV